MKPSLPLGEVGGGHWGSPHPARPGPHPDVEKKAPPWPLDTDDVGGLRSPSPTRQGKGGERDWLRAICPHWEEAPGEAHSRHSVNTC